MEYMDIEYEGWDGAVIKTNSTHRKGISFLHGDVTISFKNTDGIIAPSLCMPSFSYSFI
jgi:hypothetical protein